jgi:hypothetical protein
MRGFYDPNMKSIARLLLLAVCMLSLTGCGVVEYFDKGAKNAKKACATPDPTAMTGSPKLLPSAFPTPSGVTYVDERKDGPTTIVDAFRTGDLSSLYDAYRGALATNGWNVTKNEHDAADAEVNFAGSSTTGQVKLKQECKTRTSVTLTIRPA